MSLSTRRTTVHYLLFARPSILRPRSILCHIIIILLRLRRTTPSDPTSCSCLYTSKITASTATSPALSHVPPLTSVPSHYTCTFSFGNLRGVDRSSVNTNSIEIGSPQPKKKLLYQGSPYRVTQARPQHIHKKQTTRNVCLATTPHKPGQAPA